MKLTFDDIIDCRVNQPGVVAANGPSLDNYKHKISKDKNLVKFFVNNWFDVWLDDYFCSPDYTVLASPSPLDSIVRHREFANKYNSTILYADSVDKTPESWIDENITTDWLPYDQRHWQGKTCELLLNEFDTYVKENNNYSFKRYGNNEIMWHEPRGKQRAGLGYQSHKYPHLPTPMPDYCCSSITDTTKTLQERLQELSGFNQHYSTGDTVTLHAIAFAIISGCNPIYIAGLDLDYHAGYASGKNFNNGIYMDTFQELSKNLINDLYILNESAKKRGIDVINLKKDAWYGQFQEGELE